MINQWVYKPSVNVGYAHTIKYKLINCSWTVAAVGKGPHFLQKNPQQNFLAIWAWPAMYIPAELASKEDPISIWDWDIHICYSFASSKLIFACHQHLLGHLQS